MQNILIREDLKNYYATRKSCNKYIFIEKRTYTIDYLIKWIYNKVM